MKTYYIIIRFGRYYFGRYRDVFNYDRTVPEMRNLYVEDLKRAKQFETRSEADSVALRGDTVVEINSVVESGRKKDWTLKYQLIEYLAINNIKQQDFANAVGLNVGNVRDFIRNGFQRGLAKERIEEFFKEKNND